MNEVEEAHRAVERSRAQHYLKDWDAATIELGTAVEALRGLESALAREAPGTARRSELRASLHAFQRELRLAQRIHDQAASWESRWASAVQDSLGMRAAAYGPDGAAAAGESIRRTAWEG